MLSKLPSLLLLILLKTIFKVKFIHCNDIDDVNDDENLTQSLRYCKTATDFPVITFIEPVEVQVIDAGTPINVILETSDNSYPVVTVNLACNLTYVMSVTQNISTAISIIPPVGTYGGCTLSMSDVASYDTTDTVFFKYYRRLYFVYPENGQQINTYSDFYVLVNSLYGNSDNEARTTFHCSVGDDFRTLTHIGVLEAVNMDSGIQGACTVTATALATQYSDPIPISVTIITPIVLITPIPSVVTSGQMIQIQINSVDGANIPINVITTCNSQQHSEEISANRLQDYTFPSYLNGVTCSLFAESSEPYYDTISGIIFTVSMNSVAIANFAKSVAMPVSRSNERNILP